MVLPRKSLPPVHPSSDSPRFWNFLSNCHVASCLRCPFLFMEHSAAASRGSHILPVSRTIFPDCVDEDKCLAKGHSVSWSSLGPRLQSQMLSIMLFPWPLLGGDGNVNDSSSSLSVLCCVSALCSLRILLSLSSHSCFIMVKYT